MSSANRNLRGLSKKFVISFEDYRKRDQAAEIISKCVLFHRLLIQCSFKDYTCVDLLLYAGNLHLQDKQ